MDTTDQKGMVISMFHNMFSYSTVYSTHSLSKKMYALVTCASCTNNLDQFGTWFNQNPTL